MRLLGKIGKGMLIALGLYSLSSTCQDPSIRRNVPHKVEKQTIRSLPLEEIYLSTDVDLEGDNRISRVIVGKLKGRDKCGTYLLENVDGKYKPRRLFKEILKYDKSMPRYPMVFHEFMTTLGKNKKHDLRVAIDNDLQKKGKHTLELILDGKVRKVFLDKKKK